ncbi:DUF4082 domain-containing protein, partial [uncultured Hymenobacter sp.]|uniref:DUF4082 domain-containing protein n=1 Tax=uncultured Hymenobacter sp. TaxID=170016 RepID=UPI0035CA7C6B
MSASRAQAQANAIVTENALAGSPSTEWQIVGAGDLSIQGFATDISYNKGERARFKIKTTATAYTVTIYRLGYYQGNGARSVGTASITAGVTLPQAQGNCITDASTGLLDCGNWAESAFWDIPASAVSGVYIAKLTRSGSQNASHIVFIVRDDAGNSDLLFQTSDATWQAYNVYGDANNGKSLYAGAGGKASKVSYNRPFLTRSGGGGGGPEEDWLFNAEYPMIRWLEANGYNVSYTTNVDTDRRGALLTTHKVFMSVGHDEYWSVTARTNVAAARTAGKHLAFFSGNEVYWKTRWESNHRTLVCYKEGAQGENTCNGKCDPSTEWTGLWRGGCDFPNGGACRPENELSGQISWAENTGPLEVPATYKNLRFWRNTSVAALANGATATLTAGTIGYEWNPEQDAFRSTYPAGRMLLSQTVLGGKTHHLSLYKHSSGALVFGAGTVQWSWGLDGNHDRAIVGAGAAPSPVMKQATVNLFADMGVQPGSLETGLIAATASTDTQAPTVVINSPTAGASLPSGQGVTVTGTASDASAVAGVEISTDGGTSWRLATGTTSWTYAWTPSTQGLATIRSRAFDDSGNMSAPVVVNVTVAPPGAVVCPCTLFQPNTIPTGNLNNDGQAIQLGMKFRSTATGFITGVRFYKQSGNTGTHIGQLYSSTGTLLAQATFTSETASGWQQVAFSNAVAVTAGTTYLISYHSSSGNYSAQNPGFGQAIVNGPLRGLASGEDGPNGVYLYTASPALPTNNFQTSNYFVDVVFNTTVGPDTSPPSVTSTTPTNNAAGVAVANNISVTFSEALDPASVSTSTIQLLNGSSPVAATVAYTPGSQTVTLDPTSSLNFSTTYTVSVRGGNTDPRVKDVAGNALAATYTASFTTRSTPPPALPSPNEGPGGPILVISASANPFSRYPVEILRAEGFNEFAAKDIMEVRANPSLLNSYDVVVLGAIALVAADVPLLTNWVNAGGTLIAFKPDAQLASLLGITPVGGTPLADKYVLVNTTSGPGVGIVNQTMQFHGAADLYTLNSGTTSLATLYTSSTAASSNPAVTQKLVGTNGGKAIAFTYDLARSIVYTRQGNPAWAGQKRDGESGPIRSDDMFYRDWIDFDKVAIPQADEQQRLLANIIVKGNKKPLPRFWYLPRSLKAAVVMTGDDHGNGGTVGRFDQYLRQGPNTPLDVANWRAIRGTSYIYPSTPMTDAQAAAFEAQGFEIGLHLNTNCAAWTPTSLRSFFDTQLPQLAAEFPSISPTSTHRTHCISWSDWASQAKIEAERGIRLDDNYYYWPGAWIQDRPGLFTGSGMPMRFADLDGTLIDCYQAATQLTDESNITYSTHISTLLENALGPKGYYGVFTANMHTDQNSSPGSDAIVAEAIRRQVPVISAKQMLTWLDGRNNSSFGAMTWNANKLSFSVTVWDNVLNLEAMLPVEAVAGRLLNLTVNGAAVSYRTETIKGVPYAFFPASTGTYLATYDAVACTTPTATIAAVESSVCPGSPVALRLSTATGQAPFNLVVNGVTYPNVTVGQTFATFNSGEASIWGNTGTPTTPYVTDGNQAIEVGTKFRAAVSGMVTGIRFYKGAGNTGTHVGSLWNATGTKLATATFSGETPSGWQEVRFSTPVAITAATTYIVSYYSPDGGFAISPGFFNGTSVINGPLTALQAGTDGVNGVFRYGNGGGFPNGGNDANYWVDVLFKENAAAGPQNYVLTSITDAGGCVASGTSLSAVQVTTNPLPAGTLAASPVQVGQPINLTFTATAGTGPFALVVNGTSYPNVASGTAFNTGVVASSSSATNSIWSNATVPATAAFNDPSSTELGVKFRSSVAGQITGIRFYKGATNTGTHTGTLWSSAGAQLATATFVNETASGWQEVLFSTPVSITANTTYVASYHAPVGNYAVNSAFFATTGVTNGPLRALDTNEVVGGNGVFVGSASTAFPNQSFNATNYWVDVVFTPSNPNTFVLTSITDSKGCVKQGDLQVLTVQPTTTATAQTITFAQPLPNVTTSAGPIALTATASSNLPVSYEATGPATVSGSTLTLTGVPGTVTVTARQAGNATYAAAPEVVRTFTVTAAVAACFSDQNAGNFTAGTVGTSTYGPAAGGVILKPQVVQEFATVPPATEWQSFLWPNTSAVATTVSGGQAIVSGTRLNTEPEIATSGPGTSVEFTATFGNASNQHVGFGAGNNAAMFNTVSIWAMFSTGSNSATGLKARVSNGGAPNDFTIPGSTNLFGSPHRYRIDWKAASIEFYVDGTLVHTSAVALTTPMRVGASDFAADGVTLSLDWVRLSPFAGAGSFTSRVYDGGSAKTWNEVTWAADLPAGTSLQLLQRQGNTATPDGSWTSFAAISASGATVGGTSRYIQYRADLTTTLTSATPTLQSVAFNCATPACPPVVFTPATGTTLAPATVGVAYSQTLSTAPAGYTLTATGLPAGLTLDATTGIISGIPTATVASANVTVTATKDACTGTAAYTLSVGAANQAPVLAAVGNKSATVLVPLSFTVSANDPDGGTLTYSLTGTVPTGATINPTSGAFSWTPTQAQVGSHTFKVVASDGPASDDEEITITVANGAPTDIVLSQAGVPENRPSGTAVGSFSTGAAGPQTYAYTLVAGPDASDNASFQITGSSLTTNAAFDFEAKNTYAIRVRATENGAPNNSFEKVFAITVTDVNEAPVMASQTFAVSENSANGAVVGEVMATDPDANQSLTYSLTAGNTSNAFVLVGNSLRVNNNTALDFSINPTFTLTVRVADSGTPALNTTATVTVNVTDVNGPPVIAAQQFSVNENAAINSVVGVIAASDPDAGQTLAYSITAGDANGVFKLVGNSLQVANSTALDYEVSPQFILTVQVTDNGVPALRNSAQVTIALNAVNEAPVLANVPATATIPELLPYSFTATASDVDGDALTFSLLTAPAGAAINAVTGAFTWTPTDAQGPGSYSFRVRVTDGLLSMELPITISVTSTQAPVANAGSDRTLTLPTNSVVLTGTGTDSDGTITGYSWTQVGNTPSLATLTGATTTSLTVSNLVAGSYTFALVVTDNAGLASAADQVSVTVTSAPTGGVTALYRLNAGGPATSTSIGAFAADQYFTGGNPSGGGGAIAGTTDDVLYQTERWGAMSYNLPVANGTYTVKLHFAEVYFSNPGQRVFDVAAEGTRVLTAYDILRKVGRNTATVETFTVNVTDGQLTLAFSKGAAGADEPKVSAIEVLTTGATSNQAPVANAGPDKTLTLPTSSVELAGSGTDADGTVATYAWTQVSGPNTATFTSKTVPQPTVSGLVAGSYVFSLIVTDNQGLASAADQVSVTVTSAPTGGVTALYRLNAGGPATSTSIGAFAADQYFTGGNPSGGGGAIAGTTDDVLYQTERWGAMSYNLPVANGTYTVKLHFAEVYFSNPGQRVFDVAAEGTRVLTAYDILRKVGRNTATVETFTVNVTDGQLTLAFSKGAAGADEPKVSAIEVLTTGAASNQAPVANAGPDKTLTLPTASTTLSGAGTDPDGTVATYAWTQASGPNTATFSNRTIAQPTVSNLVAGSYTFALVVTDNAGLASAADQVSVTVTSAPTGGVTALYRLNAGGPATS